MLEDLDENLVVLGAKLKHMRDDIAAIEASNNTLERQSSNNKRLLETLKVCMGRRAKTGLGGKERVEVWARQGSRGRARCKVCGNTWMRTWRCWEQS